MLYVPILRCKAGEKDALIQLKDDVKDKIVPLFEVAPDTISKFSDITRAWKSRKFYFDLHAALEIDNEKYFELIDKCIMDDVLSDMIPVVHVSDDSEKIAKVKEVSANGIAIRVTTNELSDPDFDFSFSDMLRENELSNCDLILDAQYINNDTLNTQIFVLKSTLSTIPNLASFRRIIIASGSIPDTLNVPKEELVSIQRFEKLLFENIRKALMPKGIEPIFSDYTISHYSYFEFIPGMQMSFKIRYAAENEYFIYKGLTLKKGGLKIDKVLEGCKAIIEKSGHFKGPDFSWGDTEIYDRYSGETTGPGNLQSWVSIDENHHITLMVDLLSNRS
ncbi:beta family protein [Cytobacillus firmus]